MPVSWYKPKLPSVPPGMLTLTEAFAQGDYHGHAWFTERDFALCDHVARAPGAWPVSLEEIQSSDWVTFVNGDRVPWFFCGRQHVVRTEEEKLELVCSLKVVPFNDRLAYLNWDPPHMFPFANAVEYAKANLVAQTLRYDPGQGESVLLPGWPRTRPVR